MEKTNLEFKLESNPELKPELKPEFEPESEPDSTSGIFLSNLFWTDRHKKVNKTTLGWVKLDLIRVYVIESTTPEMDIVKIFEEADNFPYSIFSFFLLFFCL
jgi:hypothetical protein